MELFHRDLGGAGLPILILHGLFGSSRNWLTAGAALARFGRVRALDLRNHGGSPHAPTHSLDDLVDDLEEWIARHLGTGPAGERPVLVGHSMGGLAVMGFALRRPGRVRALIVVDMAPRAYPFHFEAQLEALRLDLSRFTTRAQVEAAVAPLLPDPEVRRFLLMNAERSDGGFRWVLNREALAQASFLSDAARLGAPGEVYPGPALFLAGGRSDHVQPEDVPLIRRLFPAARVETVPGADHWVQHSAPREFLRLTGGFLAGLADPADPRARG